jgi:cell division protease FtsH
VARRPAHLLRTRILPGLALLAVLGVLAYLVFKPGPDVEDLTLDQFEASVLDGDVATATVKDRASSITGEFENGDRYSVAFPTEFGDELTELLLDNDVELDTDQGGDPLWVRLLFTVLPIAILLAGVLYLVNTMPGSGRSGAFGKSRARRLTGEEPKVTFEDVAGADEAVEELREIRDFLADPERFRAIGASIPKGVLLYGPPGTGKTLLARAVAGEAGVPFFTISGSDFVEMFVGVGASRVRDLFEQAKTAAPAIIFIDEIDAVGRHRGSGHGGGHDEREQTLNQLLVEMDGFDGQTGVIMIAATNRPDILDPALLRPGRFDRQIVVDNPDLVGRRAILDVHAKGKPLGERVSLDVLARRTPGFTGADLSNLLNEAALLAARRRLAEIGMAECEDAIDRVIAGPERRTRVLSDREKSVIAHHEAGHALVGHVLAGTDPIHKVSIVSRGRALGWTLALPTEDRVLRSRNQLRDELAMLLGGRTAEELVFDDVTTGAQDDIERATKIARAMITQWGMSFALGPRAMTRSDTASGRDAADHGDELAGLIDDEVHALIDEAHSRARAVLVGNRETLDRLASTLVERETLDEEELAEVFGDASDPGLTAPIPMPAPEPDPGDLPLTPVRERVPVGATAAVPLRVRLRERLGAWRRSPDVPEGFA